MTETWNIFAARDILIGGFAAAGFLAVIVVIARASYNVSQRERVLKVAADRKKANEMTAEYEQELESVRKQAQLEITNSQKIHKEIFEIELDISQKYIDNLLDKLTKDILSKKEIALNSLETVTQSLCTEIESKLSI